MKKRNLSTKHALKNELKQVRVVRSEVLSPEVCFSMLLDPLTEQSIKNGDICILHKRTATHVNSGHLTHSNKVYAGPKMAGIQKTQV